MDYQKDTLGLFSMYTLLHSHICFFKILDVFFFQYGEIIIKSYSLLNDFPTFLLWLKLPRQKKKSSYLLYSLSMKQWKNIKTILISTYNMMDFSYVILLLQVKKTATNFIQNWNKNLFD